MSAPVLAILLLAGLAPGAGSATRATAYYQEGLRDFRREHFEQALRSAELAYRLGQDAYLDDDFLADTLHLATSAAVRSGTATPAVRWGRESLDWARKHGGEPVAVARAALDLTEAYLLLDSPDDARKALAEATAALAGAPDSEEAARRIDLESRLLGYGQQPSPTASPANAPPSSSRAR